MHSYVSINLFASGSLMLCSLPPQPFAEAAGGGSVLLEAGGLAPRDGILGELQAALAVLLSFPAETRWTLVNGRLSVCPGLMASLWVRVGHPWVKV